MGAQHQGSELRRMAIILVALLAVTGVIALLTAGGSGSDTPERGTRDGVLVQVSAQRLVLDPADGGANVTYDVRPVDARTLDIFHLETHARDGLPSRVHYVEQDGRRYAVRVDDL